MPASFSANRRDVAQFVRQKCQERPVYLDTETTGLERGDEIVEIAIVDDDGNCLFDSLVRPSQPIPAAASKVHHITNEMVKNARPWPILWPVIRPLLVGRLVVVYNAEFDLRMMQQSHARYKLPWRENLNTLCAMELYARYRGEWDMKRRAYRFIRLEEAGQHCKIDLPNSHRALDDALLARALFHYMAENE